jgi:putative phosphoribosyl transferase
MPTLIHENEISVATGRAELTGTLTVPAKPTGLVIFAHGSGSGRLSPRNIAVARSLADRNCATFLFDLLTVFESHDRRNVFNIDLLADRMVAATRRLHEQDQTARLPLGYFGASTGAAAALIASVRFAEQAGEKVAAIVSRGGRPDLAGEYLPRVTAPTLLLVGSLDWDVLQLNRQAQSMMTCEARLTMIEGATHLFEEPGTLEEVARHASEWFDDGFRKAGQAASDH